MKSTALKSLIIYYLSEHPSIVRFRWGHTQSWGSTWIFLLTSISLYVFLSLFLHLLLRLILRRDRAVPLGPIPAIHSLLMSLISATIFAGMLISASSEIRETRWFWHRSKTTPFQWLLCFPLGTRPSGRVFFWSYAFYLSRYFHMVRTIITVLRRRRLAFSQLFYNSVFTLMTFLWLEFSQSYQVVAILFTSLVYALLYAYRFWTGVGLPGRVCIGFVVNLQVALVMCNVVCHVAVLMLHVMKGGCNGIGAWGFNSVLNGASLTLFLNFYINRYLRKKKTKTMEDKGRAVNSYLVPQR